MKRQMVLLLVLLLTPAIDSLGHSLADLKPLRPLVPEPSQGQACDVPPIPSGDDYYVTMRAEGWSLDRGRLWREWQVQGRRYHVEYGIRSGDGKGIVPTVFPERYSFDGNGNGHFEVPGEVFVDVRGDGRCADLRPVLVATADRPA